MNARFAACIIKETPTGPVLPLLHTMEWTDGDAGRSRNGVYTALATAKLSKTWDNMTEWTRTCGQGSHDSTVEGPPHHDRVQVQGHRLTHHRLAPVDGGHPLCGEGSRRLGYLRMGQEGRAVWEATAQPPPLPFAIAGQAMRGESCSDQGQRNRTWHMQVEKCSRSRLMRFSVDRRCHNHSHVCCDDIQVMHVGS